jgi:phage tail sheath gpL-like
MSLQATSLAAAVGAAVQNEQFQATAEVLPRKIFIIGTYDPSLSASVDDEVPVLITSPEDAGARFGFGFMIHRLAIQTFRGSKGVQTWVVPQAEEGAAVVADGTFTFTATSPLAGTVYLYIAGIAVPFTISAGATAADIATAAAAAITANADLPVTAAPNGTTPEQVDVTAKSKGPWGNEISITFNRKSGEEFPQGVSVAVVDMASGAGVPDIQDALDAIGTGDDANEKHFTDLDHGYLQDAATLTAIANYVGQGNAFTGLYDKLVARPFRALTGDVAIGSAALTALIAITDLRKTDRANGIIAVPGSANHPSEIAAQTIGHMARINNDRAEQSYEGIVLIDIDPGDAADRWTSDYDNRDTAVKSGISPTKVEGNAVLLQNVVSFYRPDSVPVSSNGYRSMRNISIIQNILSAVKLNFSQERWQGISIVEDVTKVGNTTSREKARDISAVLDDLVALANSFEDNAWIFTASFTIEELAQAGSVVIRAGGTGFDNTMKVIFSGEGGIIDTVVKFDTSIAVLLS